MSEYFPKPNSLRANIKVKLDLSKNPTKTDLKNEAGVDKSDVDKLDIDKLKMYQVV